MVEETAAGYAKLLRSAELDKEINPLCCSIEDMLTRLEEFETLVANVRAETNGIMANHVCSIISFSDNFKALRDRIDNLEKFVNIVDSNLDEVEKSVDIAEKELHITDYSFKSLVLKPLLAKAKQTTATAATASTSSTDSTRSNLIDGEYQPIPIFNCNSYFKSANGVNDTPKNM